MTIVILSQLFMVAVANYTAFLVRFDGVIPPDRVSQMFKYLPLLLVIQTFLFLYHGLHRDLWRYSSIGNLVRIIKAVTIGSVLFFIAIRYIAGEAGYPRSVYVLDWMLLILMLGGSRLLIRVHRESMVSGEPMHRVLIIGAGNAGEMIVRDMKSNPKYNYVPVGFIDDDIHKRGLVIHDVPVIGTTDEIPEIVGKVEPDEFLICIPSAGRNEMRVIYDKLKPAAIPIKVVPGLREIVHGNVTVSSIKPLSIEDLLQRQQVSTGIAGVREFLGGKRVLISGAGGSIGSELARQIASYCPAKLVLLDRYENGLFAIDGELKGKDGVVDSVIRDVTDSVGLEAVFEKHKPEIVFHAAAHKHVPLMEGNPLEAVKNNVFGTSNLIELSRAHGVRNFVMISTDKAVNPTNVMGSTKRIAEFLSLKANGCGETRFTTVRFGNVLGSNGSVFHVFKRQIAQGGPVTVTHPDIKRFFMLIPEAVELVLVAASIGKGGEIFVLDMGDPVKILDFAENFIRLSGFVPHQDIEITFTGLRPGEKLYEELFDASEERIPAELPGLSIARANVPDYAALSIALDEFRRAIDANNETAIPRIIASIVPGYRGGAA